ncbi:MAG: Caldesmon [Sulfurimonas sp.]|nr:MAG: Caldesmon [Sulfurimonas sp.]
MPTNTTIKCPNCNTNIDVNDILYHQLEDELKQKNIAEQKNLKDEVEAKRKEYKQAFDTLKIQEEAIKEQQEKFDEELKKATTSQLKVEKQKLQESIKKELEEEQSESIALLKKELDEKSNQVKELNKSKAEREKLKREKEEITSRVQAEAEIALTQRLQVEKQAIQKASDEQNELKLKQKEEQLKQLQEQLQIAQRKAEQGSMQLQGEVQELAIEEYLTDKYPFDVIQEIKKGARGADCIQVVHTREVQNCGKIYYESKRTKDFQKTWIEKFKADMRDKAVDVGVLVTEVLPSSMDRMGLVDGVWVCTFEEFKGLSSVLRDGVIKIHHAKKSEENKTDKMSLLYGYLTSTEFSMQIEAIVEGFTTMKTDLETEKRSMARIWKQRDKQIEKVLDNTIGMYGSIKGIAGNAIGNVKALELPYSDMDEGE